MESSRAENVNIQMEKYMMENGMMENLMGMELKYGLTEGSMMGFGVKGSLMAKEKRSIQMELSNKGNGLMESSMNKEVPHRQGKMILKRIRIKNNFH